MIASIKNSWAIGLQSDSKKSLKKTKKLIK